MSHGLEAEVDRLTVLPKTLVLSDREPLVPGSEVEDTAVFYNNLMVAPSPILAAKPTKHRRVFRCDPNNVTANMALNLKCYGFASALTGCICNVTRAPLRTDLHTLRRVYSGVSEAT